MTHLDYVKAPVCLENMNAGRTQGDDFSGASEDEANLNKRIRRELADFEKEPGKHDKGGRKQPPPPSPPYLDILHFPVLSKRLEIAEHTIM